MRLNTHPHTPPKPEPEVPVNFSASRYGPYQPELRGFALLSGRLAWASGPAERTIHDQDDVAVGGAVAAEALFERSCKRHSPMRLYAKMFAA